jgi:hypothetical protein
LDPRKCGYVFLELSSDDDGSTFYLSLKAVIPVPVRIETIPWARTLAPRGEDGPRGQFFKQIFAPTEKFAPTQYSAHAIVRAYARVRAYASFKKLASGVNTLCSPLHSSRQ